jgi:hypothetical protein
LFVAESLACEKRDKTNHYHQYFHSFSRRLLLTEPGLHVRIAEKC